MSTGLILGITLGTVAVLSCAVLIVAGMVSGKPDPLPAAATAGPAVQAATTSAAKPTPSPAPPKTSAAPATVAMPNLVKKNAAVARDELDKLGFINIQFGSQDAEDTVVILASNWTVTKQSTAAGTQVSTDTLIVLTCTKKA